MVRGKDDGRVPSNLWEPKRGEYVGAKEQLTPLQCYGPLVPSSLLDDR